MIDLIKETILTLLLVINPVGSTIDSATAVQGLLIPNPLQCVNYAGTVLSVGATGPIVKELQQVLNVTPDTRVALSGAGSPGNETEYFGTMTKTAVIKFQEKHRTEILVPLGLSAGSGYVGERSFMKVNSICRKILASGLKQSDITASIPLFSSSTKPSTIIATTSKPITIAPTSTKPTTATSTAPTTTPALSTKIINPTTTPLQPALTPLPVTSLEWGAFPGNNAANLVTFETMVGKQVKLRSMFTNWYDGFPLLSTDSLKTSGKKLVLFWEQYGVTLDSIIAGESDAYITKFAEGARAYGGPIILAPFHEMNGNWDPWDGTVGQNTPAKVVSAWKHVRTVFGNVPNVQFAWTVNNGSVPNTAANAITAYYPGDAYVDIVGIDGFNFGNPWQTFDEAFRTPLATLAVYNKPIYILSMASEAGTGKAAWITDAVTVQMKKYPLLKGWVWFNESKSHNWRIDSDPTSLVAFKAGVR